MKIQTNQIAYSDIENSFAKNAIIKWTKHKVITGFAGEFRPKVNITRGEFAVILNRILGFDNISTDASIFKDLDDNFYTQSICLPAKTRLY